MIIMTLTYLMTSYLVFKPLQLNLFTGNLSKPILEWNNISGNSNPYFNENFLTTELIYGI